MKPNPALAELSDTLLDAVAKGGLVKLTIHRPTATAGDLKSIDIRPILIKRELKLSFTYHHQTRDVVKNFPPHEAAALMVAQLEEHFRAAHLYTTEADYVANHAQNGYQMSKRAPSKTHEPELSHDRAKHRLIQGAGKPYLQALGITDAKGAVYKNAQDKFRQINKYIEILDGLVRGLAPRETLRVVDMGAGKGYLTFALYDYLTTGLKLKVEIVGVEHRAELVSKCNAIALASGFAGLSFVQGSIAAYDCTGADIIIALHACDTATDDAIAKAIRADAALIVVAPCCHKQVRRAMGKLPSEHPLAPMLHYGTYTERMAEMLTDGLRAQVMELHGYRSNLFEFISDAHTPKNVMIVGTKDKIVDAEKIQEAIKRTKVDFGIEFHQLERLLSA